jgi:hypothetical protein
MSLLETFQGSSNDDGGQTAVACLSAGSAFTRAPRGDYYQFLATLPKQSYEGPLRKGGYCTWAPGSVRETMMVPYGNLSYRRATDVAPLMLTFRRDDPEQTVRIIATFNYEAVSDSLNYIYRVEPFNIATDQMLVWIAETHRAYENSTHKGILARLWRGIKDVITKPDNWLKAIKWGIKVLT